MIELALVLQQIADQVGKNADNIGRIHDSVDSIASKFDRSNAVLDHMLVRIETLEKMPNVNTANIARLAEGLDKVNTLLSDHCDRLEKLETKPKKA